jgi:MYXO-CTERM domain-containing protein
MRMTMKIQSTLSVTLSVLSLSTSALATPNFPDAIAAHLGAPAPPSCQVCHNGRTGAGTVTRAFGASMRERGLVPYNADSLKSALDRMAKDGVDSNGDAVIDTEALKKGEDPNATAGGEGAQPIGDRSPRPEYGCSASSAGSETKLSWTAWMPVAAFLLTRRRRATR